MTGLGSVDRNGPPWAAFLLAYRYARGVDEAKFPGNQHADKQHDGKSNAKGQGARHVVGLGLAIAAILQHEVQRGAEAAYDGKKCDCDKGSHAGYYPVIAARRLLRFWLLTAAALVGLLLTASLGVWQMSRAAQKIALQQVIEERQKMPPLDGAALVDASAVDGLMHRQVVLRGTWLAKHAVFLDNRQMNGKPGFFVVTPLRLEGSGAVIVVQRGWVQRSFTERAQLPPLATDTAVVQIAGRIAPPPSKLYEFAGADQGVIRQNLDLRQYAGEIGADLLPVSLLQVGGSTDGLQRDWPRVEAGVAKHYGYAFQWFALSALITILYVWFQIVRRNPAPR